MAAAGVPIAGEPATDTTPEVAGCVVGAQPGLDPFETEASDCQCVIDVEGGGDVADAAILGHDGSVGMRFFPVSPGAGDDRKLLELYFGVQQRAGQCLTREGVEDREVIEVEHHLVASGEEARRAELQGVEPVDVVGEVRLGRTTERAVGDADSAATDGGVDHLVDLHDVLRERHGLIVDHHAEDRALIGIPVATRRVGEGGVVDGGDTTALAHAHHVVAGSIVDQHTAPAVEAPVDK